MGKQRKVNAIPLKIVPSDYVAKKAKFPFFKGDVLESLVSLLQEIQMGQLMHLK